MSNREVETVTEYCVTFNVGSDLEDFYSEDKEEADAFFEENKDKVKQYFRKDWIKVGGEFQEDYVEVFYNEWDKEDEDYD